MQFVPPPFSECDPGDRDAEPMPRSSKGLVIHPLTEREFAALLAGIRLIEAETPRGAYLPQGVSDIATDGGRFPALDVDELIALAKKINFAAEADDSAAKDDPADAGSSPLCYRCPECERRDSLSWGASAYWSEDEQRFVLSDHLEGAYCQHCGEVDAIQHVIPDASDWADASSFEIASVALIQSPDGRCKDWKRCESTNHQDEVNDGERLIRAAYGVYWRDAEGLAMAIEDFDNFKEADEFAAAIAGDKAVWDLTGLRVRQGETDDPR